MHEVKKVGDVGEVIEKGFWQQAGDEPSITDVYQSLIAIEEVSGLKSQEKKAVLVENLLRSVDPLSAKYIVRIVLGKLRLGFSDMTIIDALSWMVAGDKSLKTIIENAYNICVDLGLIARTLKKDGIDGVKQMSITLGIPIRPAAAERLPTAQEIFEKIGPCSAQPKLDGFRLQIHLDTTANKIFFFSRNLKNMSAMFPDLVQALKK